MGSIGASGFDSYVLCCKVAVAERSMSAAVLTRTHMSEYWVSMMRGIATWIHIVASITMGTGL